MLGQRCGYANDNGIRLTEASQVSGCLEASSIEESLHSRRRDVLDIARTTVQLVDLGDIDVKAHDPEAHLAEAQDQR